MSINLLFNYILSVFFNSETVLRIVSSSKANQPTEVAANFQFDPPLLVEIQDEYGRIPNIALSFAVRLSISIF